MQSARIPHVGIKHTDDFRPMMLVSGKLAEMS